LGILQKGGLGHGGLKIECIRIGGVEIPNHKRVEYSLQYIHGIGRTRSRQILLDLSFDNKVTKDLSEEEVITLRKEVTKYMIEGDLVMSLIPLHQYDLSMLLFEQCCLS
jgi:small subunit ribosomal protein S13